MWIEIGLVVLIVIVIIGLLAYVLLSEDGSTQAPPQAVPQAVPQAQSTQPAPSQTLPIAPVPSLQPAPIQPSLSPAAPPTPSPVITPTPVVTTTTTASGLPSGIVNGDVIRDTTTGKIFKIAQGKRREYPDLNVYRSWGSPAYKDFPSRVVTTIPFGTPMPLKVTTTTTSTTSTAPAPAPAPTTMTQMPTLTNYTNLYRQIAYADITPGVNQWTMSGTVDQCAKKCGTTMGCLGFTRNGSQCYGKTSNVINKGSMLVYFGKNTASTGTREGTAAPAPTMSTAPAPAPTTPTQRPILYKDSNYGGAAWTVPGPGTHALTGSGIKNEVTSIKVPAGWRLTVYDKDDCTGTSAVYTSSIANLSGTGLNNDIACVKLATR